MPIYTFRCPEPGCDVTVTALVKMNDKSVPVHNCKSKDKYNFVLPLERALDVPSPMQWGCRKGF